MKFHHRRSFSRKGAAHPKTFVMRRGGLAWTSAKFALAAALGCIVLAIAGTGCGGDDKTEAQPTVASNASTLLQQLIGGINAGDQAAAMAVFADDAVSEGGPACATSSCVGKSAIDGDVAIYIHENVSFSACQTEGSGSTATARCEVRTNGTRGSGIDRFIASIIAETQDGKLSAFRWGALDISDQQTAKYWATNGAALYQLFLDSINSGDVAAVMALFADDAIFEGVGECSPAGTCTGKRAIQHEIERQVAANVSLTATKPQLFAPFGSVTTVTDDLEMHATSGAGQPTAVSVTLEMRDGKIASARFVDVRD